MIDDDVEEVYAPSREEQLKVGSSRELIYCSRMEDDFFSKSMSIISFLQPIILSTQPLFKTTDEAKTSPLSSFPFEKNSRPLCAVAPKRFLHSLKMPLSSNKWKRKTPPEGFDAVEGILEALENELRDKVKETNAQKRKTESMWPVHQINWQKSRYIYDMFYTHKRISRQVYQYCLDQKLVDAGLIAKWKKPGYERLCSTYVINPANYKFGTTSICRVPWKDRSPEQRGVADPTTGCLGCASGGADAGPRNIFGTKYGQNLAAVQIAREKRQAAKEEREKQKAQETAIAAAAEAAEKSKEDEDDDDDGDAPTDDDAETDDDSNDDDFGPSPAAGIWAGSKKLEQESEHIADPDDDDNDEDGPAPPKKARTEE